MEKKIMEQEREIEKMKQEAESAAGNHERML